jgi:very-short-patch-repair endonuclease
MHGEKRPVDSRIAALAARQQGVVARRQLEATGLGKGAIDHRVSAGRLHPVFRGVYAVGHRRLTRRGWFMAAVLACGYGAVLSHFSAAELLGVGRSRSGIHVTTPNRNLHGQKGIVLHRARALRPEHRTTIDGIPVTTVPRLLADLAGTLDKTGLKRVWQEAQRRKLLDVEAVKPLASQPRRGIGNLNALIDEAEDAPDTKTEFEHRFHDFIRARDIPAPAYNVAIGPYVVDALWPGAKLVVELDSRAYHWHRAEEDAERHADLLVAGYLPYHVTWKALTRRPDALESRLRRLLRTVG